MRGLENILSFILLFSLLLLLAYAATTTFVQYMAGSAYAERRLLTKYNWALAIQYSGVCTERNTIEVNYSSRIPEYYVRLLCIYDQNSDWCIVPTVDGKNALPVLAPWAAPTTLEYNIVQCGWGETICRKLRCYVLGLYRAYPLPIT